MFHSLRLLLALCLLLCLSSATKTIDFNYPSPYYANSYYQPENSASDLLGSKKPEKIAAEIIGDVIEDGFMIGKEAVRKPAKIARRLAASDLKLIGSLVGLRGVAGEASRKARVDGAN